VHAGSTVVELRAGTLALLPHAQAAGATLEIGTTPSLVLSAAVDHAGDPP
jgi:hypothetical protein